MSAISLISSAVRRIRDVLGGDSLGPVLTQADIEPRADLADLNEAVVLLSDGWVDYPEPSDDEQGTRPTANPVASRTDPLNQHIDSKTGDPPNVHHTTIISDMFICMPAPARM